MRSIIDMDAAVARAIASIQGHNLYLDRMFGPLFALPTYKTYPFVIVALALWFANDRNPIVRQKLIAGGLGGALAMFLTHALQWAAPARLRPIQTGDYPFVWGRIGLDASSFPSDTMGLTCALALGIWAASRNWGILAFAWAVIVVAGGKMYSGQHYLSDILVGAAIGLASTAVCLKSPLAAWLNRRLSALESRKPTLFYLLFFIGAFQVAALFEDLRLTGNAILSRKAFKTDSGVKELPAEPQPNGSIWTGA